MGRHYIGPLSSIRFQFCIVLQGACTIFIYHHITQQKFLEKKYYVIVHERTSSVASHILKLAVNHISHISPDPTVHLTWKYQRPRGLSRKTPPVTTSPLLLCPRPLLPTSTHTLPASKEAAEREERKMATEQKNRNRIGKPKQPNPTHGIPSQSCYANSIRIQTLLC